MATVAANKIAALNKLRCSIFQTLYNPTSVRTGAKYLRARLRGPSMINYYPPVLSIAQLKKGNPGWEIQDEDEIQRFQDVEDRKKRGKGAPKKAKSKGTSASSPRMLDTFNIRLKTTVAGNTGSGRLMFLAESPYRYAIVIVSTLQSALPSNLISRLTRLTFENPFCLQRPSFALVSHKYKPCLEVFPEVVSHLLRKVTLYVTYSANSLC